MQFVRVFLPAPFRPPPGPHSLNATGKETRPLYKNADPTPDQLSFVRKTSACNHPTEPLALYFVRHSTTRCYIIVKMVAVKFSISFVLLIGIYGTVADTVAEPGKSFCITFHLLFASFFRRRIARPFFFYSNRLSTRSTEREQVISKHVSYDT